MPVHTALPSPVLEGFKRSIACSFTLHRIWPRAFTFSTCRKNYVFRIHNYCFRCGVSPGLPSASFVPCKAFGPARLSTSHFCVPVLTNSWSYQASDELDNLVTQSLQIPRLSKPRQCRPSLPPLQLRHFAHVTRNQPNAMHVSGRLHTIHSSSSQAYDTKKDRVEQSKLGAVSKSNKQAASSMPSTSPVQCVCSAPCAAQCQSTTPVRLPYFLAQE